jgi:hypothetical protein
MVLFFCVRGWFYHWGCFWRNSSYLWGVRILVIGCDWWYFDCKSLIYFLIFWK